MKTSIIIFILVLGIKVGHSQSFKKSSEKFKANCTTLITPSEKIIKSWYHYVVSRNQNKEYILRIFYPQTNQVTTYEIYSSKKLKKKNGKGEYWFENGNKQSEGTYLNNEKQGFWKHYNIHTGNLNSEGIYSNGKQNGEWKEFSNSGWLQSTFTYQDDIHSGPFTEYDSLSNIINQGEYRADTIFTQIKNDTSPEMDVEEVMPFLKICSSIENLEKRKNCSDRELVRYIQENIKYPREAREYGIEGRGFAQFTIDENGHIGDINILRSHCEQIKQELIRMVENIPEFSPGLQNGKPVKVMYTLPFTFKLE